MVKKLILGDMQTNCYILYKDNNCIIIDPGSEYNRILPLLNNYNLSAIILTHGHFDHIGAVDQLYNKYQCPIYLHKDDHSMVRDNPYNKILNIDVSIKSPLIEIKEGTLTIDNFKFDIYFTPGHSPGGIILIYQDYMISGDTLFNNSIGRTDLEGSDHRQMVNSLKFIKTFDPKLKVLPGHGLDTTLEDELRNNPFLRK